MKIILDHATARRNAGDEAEEDLGDVTLFSYVDGICLTVGDIHLTFDQSELGQALNILKRDEERSDKQLERAGQIDRCSQTMSAQGGRLA